MERHSGGSWLAGGLAVLSGLAFATFPILRPWGDKEVDDDGSANVEAMAEAFADPFWVISHVSGMLGWALLLAAVIATPAVALTAKLLLGLGVSALLPFYGAETFGLHVVAAAAQERGDLSLLDLEEAIRGEATALGLFGAGLIIAAVAITLVARDAWRSPRMRWAGFPLAVLIALYLPQFFAPDALRILHGLLLVGGCLLWAVQQAGGTKAGRHAANGSGSQGEPHAVASQPH
ncbi:hypothetical protein HGQ17_05525 [Nesterenkonia sp. MY13]|uniref:DUF4386 family protein n=1 Tax=Nesterenkonia sedimenti TaxID=1463632 RepID=A0A7X8YDI9_9MICC|nr:hypothetical protein [Nesterenkonia sedimenti]NLS09475.1 hypothetical protein [Nesterenkonia sedimenti]